jgi:hypothetical protein
MKCMQDICVAHVCPLDNGCPLAAQHEVYHICQL